jgi:hypothetical protein
MYSTFDKIEGEVAFSGLMYKHNFDSTSHYFGLFSDKLVSTLVINIGVSYSITYIHTDDEYQGIGCFRFLLNKALDIFDNIISDHHQTKEASDAWKGLIKYPGGKFNVYVYTEDGSLSDTRDVPESEIWNGNTFPILLISKISHSFKQQQFLDKLDESSKRVGRDYMTLFHGPNSSGTDYINP